MSEETKDEAALRLEVLEKSVAAYNEHTAPFIERLHELNHTGPAGGNVVQWAVEHIIALREALEPFAKCADELDATEDTPRAPDGEWAKFRLLTDDYRRARAALNAVKSGQTG